MKSVSPTTLIVMGLIIVCVISFGMYSKNKTNESSLINSNPKNSTYIVEGQEVALTNGYAEVVTAAGSAAKTLTQYFGNELQIDVNKDGKIDSVFFLTQNTGGSGTFFYVALARQTENGYAGSKAVFVGDRIEPQSIAMGPENTIVVHYNDRGINDSFAVTPSVQKNLVLMFNVETMQFEKVTQEEPVTASISYTNATADLITVELPFPGAVVGKTFSVVGTARGSWFFEASFPIVVIDENKNEIATGIAQAEGEWMTENFVPFTSEILIPESFIGPATLMLKKDNPSGLPENDASISFPIIIEY
jgi:hypothetical protein